MTPGRTALASLLAASLPAAADGPWLAAELTRVDAAAFAIAADGGIDAVEYRLSGEAPLAGGGERRTALGLDYSYTRYEYAGLAGRNRDLHRLELPLVRSWTRGAWAFSARAAPGLSASSNVFRKPADRWSRDELTLAAGVTARYRGNGPWSWRIGVLRECTRPPPRSTPAAR